VDAYRSLHPDAEGAGYTWWSNRGAAWDKNVGWRIDYQLITPGLRPRLKAARVYRDSRFSDHAPLIVDYAN
jgi:exodeoxyribonuclease III